MKWHHFGPHCDVRKSGGRFYHWNYFRYSADVVHLLGIFICLAALLRDRRIEGVSLKTQVLYLLIFTLRYLNLFFCTQYVYLVILKATFWASTFLIVLLLLWGGAALDKRDTCSLRLLLVPTAVFTVLLARYDSVVEVLAIFSQHLEGFAMLPQYIYCYRQKSYRGKARCCVLLYVLCLGGYRMLYGMNWLYKYLFTYVELSNFLSGLCNVVFFADFLAFKLRGSSPLSRMVLAVDDGLNDAKLFAEGMLFRGVLPGELHIGLPQERGPQQSSSTFTSAQALPIGRNSSEVDEVELCPRNP